MSTWTLEYTKTATKALSKLDRPVQRRLVAALEAVIATGEPRARGKGLSGPLAGLWRYRIGDWRVVVDIQEDRMVVVALDLAHRSTVYED